MAETKTKTELNFRGLACPMPIVKTSMALKKAVSGDEFEVVCDNPGFEPDIKAWAEQTGNILKSIRKEGADIIAEIVKK